MSEGLDDLWPDAINETPATSPVVILQKQATALGQKTGGIVTAKIVNYESHDREWVNQGFFLVAPALGDYNVRLFEVYYQLTTLYPIRVDGELQDKSGQVNTIRFDANSESEFLDVLRRIFSDPRTVNAIKAIRAHSEGRSIPEKDPPF